MTGNHSRIIRSLNYASLVAIVILACLFANSATEKISEIQGTVLGADNYDRRGLRIRIRLDSGEDMRIVRDKSIELKHADRVTVEVWKRQLFGYVTIYRKI